MNSHLCGRTKVFATSLDLSVSWKHLGKVKIHCPNEQRTRFQVTCFNKKINIQLFISVFPTLDIELAMNIFKFCSIFGDRDRPLSCFRSRLLVCCGSTHTLLVDVLWQFVRIETFLYQPSYNIFPGVTPSHSITTAARCLSPFVIICNTQETVHNIAWAMCCCLTISHPMLCRKLFSQINCILYFFLSLFAVIVTSNFLIYYKNCILIK